MTKKKKGNVVQMKKTVDDVKSDKMFDVLKKAYIRMIEAQANFSDIAVERASEIGRDHGIDIQQILGVSFAPNMAIVAGIHDPKILKPGEQPGQKQFNIPVPYECLCLDDWKDEYIRISTEMNDSIKDADKAGDLDTLKKGTEK